ncbi:MAG TPA: hypothetical protein DD413_03420 [Ruminococcus sp.]|nr:hypothetical protein [Ruminococcus sp.]
MSAQKESFYKVVLPPIDELGKNTATAARIASEILKVPMYEITDKLLKREEVLVQNGLTLEQAKIIEQQFQKESISINIVTCDSKPENDVVINNHFVVRCPKCGSTEYHAGARGFNLVTGFIGSGKTVLTCLKCGHRWKPGK